jgi:hypothetical protein
MSDALGIKELLARACYALISLTIHFLFLMVCITLVWASERYLNFLWGESAPYAFGVVAWKSVFDTIDLILISLFTAVGIHDLYITLKG